VDRIGSGVWVSATFQKVSPVGYSIFVLHFVLYFSMSSASVANKLLHNLRQQKRRLSCGF